MSGLYVQCDISLFGKHRGFNALQFVPIAYAWQDISLQGTCVAIVSVAAMSRLLDTH